MRIRIISVGKVKTAYVRDGEAEYLKRLGNGPLQVERIEVDAETVSGSNSEPAQLKEAGRILARLAPEDYLVVLDVRGRAIASEAFADWLRARIDTGVRTMVIAIGGANGWHPSIFQRAQTRLSLSELTFPYQLTRLILIEQLYRAGTIIQGVPYHK